MIRVLPPEVVNQIAAGEVVERPFSVVKELVENSLDAGASRLRIELEDGGRALIRITDDGAGFEPGDLELAFVSHATSKLGELSDLDHIASLGFRGEALASIGSIARTSIRSRTKSSDSGHEVRCVGGAIEPVRPCSAAPGTVVEVRDLFFNTPARRRFLKSERAEKARIHEMIQRLAFARIDVDFTFVVDGKEILRLPVERDLRDRIARTLGRDVAENLHPVSLVWDDHRVAGYAGDPDLARRDSTRELLYINGRLARDKSAGHAVRQAYREYLMGGRHPVYVLQLSLPPEQVDVNVHPTKSEVRFLDGRRVAGLLHDAVRGALAGRGSSVRPESTSSLAVSEDKPRARSGFPALGPGLFHGTRPAAAAERAVPTAARADATSSVPAERRTVPNPFADLEHREFLQVADLYIVLEGDDGALVVVDQHALHERVMYERLLRKHASREAAFTQRLLVPEVVELTPADKAFVLDARDCLADEGLEIADFGGDAIAIEAIPAVLDRIRPQALIESFLHGSDDARPTTDVAIRERFHSMACRSSIMSGDSLSHDEIRTLLVEAATLEHPHNCPHGRPTTLTFGASELERFFRRRI
ncbi:MAG: DNA mismatch repair endonuclease MutL [Planctomycetes bacterium]|nr:DNA mismatch repair endonuclease MutL [Planctomycetota bacterium]